MNFLAHAVLSFGDRELLIGNMIADFVKGKNYQFPGRISEGIRLHRLIDEFADVHPETKHVKKLFSTYGHYAAVFPDVVYDYFLANDIVYFPSSGDLLDFSQEVYDTLQSQLHELPHGFQTLFPYMKQHNWLYNYRTKEGIAKSFGGLVHRAKYINDASEAIDIFQTNLERLRNHYLNFMPSLKHYAESIISAD